MVDTTAVDIVCERISSIVVDIGTGGTVLIVDGTTGHRLFSTDISGYFDVDLHIPYPSSGPPVIDVTVTGAGTVVYIYLGSGPR